MNRHPPGGRAASRPSVCPAWADALRRGIHLSASVRSRTKLCFPPWGPEAPVLPLFYPVCPDTGRWFKLSSLRGMPLDLRMVCGGLAAPAPASASRCFRHGAALRCWGRGRAEPRAQSWAPQRRHVEAIKLLPRCLGCSTLIRKTVPQRHKAQYLVKLVLIKGARV